MAITPDGTRIYVANSGDNSVSVINTATNAVTGKIAVGSIPSEIAITDYGARAYVTNQSSPGSVSVINTRKNIVIATIAVGDWPVGIAIIPQIGPPTSTDQCRNANWKLFNTPRKFKSRLDCMSFVESRQ